MVKMGEEVRQSRMVVAKKMGVVTGVVEVMQSGVVEEGMGVVTKSGSVAEKEPPSQELVQRVEDKNVSIMGKAKEAEVRQQPHTGTKGTTFGVLSTIVHQGQFKKCLNICRKFTNSTGPCNGCNNIKEENKGATPSCSTSIA